MRWKKRFSGIFLFLTLLHCALCNRQSRDKIGQKGKDDRPTTSIIPGPETAILQSGHVVHLDNMSFLDPYNLMASMKRGQQSDNKAQHPLLKAASNSKPSSKKVSGSKQRTTRYRLPDNGKRIDEEEEGQSSSTSVPKSDKTVNDTKSDQKSEHATDASFFGDDDFDVYDDYSDVESVSDDFDDAYVKSGKRRKWKKRYVERNALLHEAVRKLLGFSHSPKAGSKNRRLLPDPNREDRLPRYVKDLYERFQSGEMSAGLAKGNIVRSIHGSIGEIDGKAVFLFNLSSLRSSEQLLNAEIHLYKRRLRYKLNALDIEVRLFQVGSDNIREAGKIVMKEPGFGWQWYDVTTAVRNCLNQKHHDLFALSFRANKSNGKSKTVSLRKFGKHHSMPFLVLYSNESEAASFDQLDLLADRLWARKDDELDNTAKSPKGNHVTTEESASSVNRNGRSRDTRVPHNNADNEYANNDVIPPSTSAERVAAKLRSRGKRSIYNNEIPEGPEMNFKKFHNQYHNKIPHTHPGILKTRKESKVGFDKRRFRPVSDRQFGVHRRRRKKHRNKKHRRGRLAFPKEWDNYASKKKAGRKDSTAADICGRKKLSVDFADIGWGDWIISPKSFDAHYCIGACPFPIMKHLRPSNHATIQSIVHAIGIHGKVPAPCCVPDVMSSVTLLYFDEDRNVVLKNYPGMTVDSCACR